MPDIPWSDISWEAIWSRDLVIASIFALVGAAIRGLTGFGANLIWAPALVVLYGPAETVAIMGITGILSAFPMFVPAMGKVDWREIRIIIVSAFALAPAGVWSLLYLDPDMFRRIMGGLIFLMAGLLMTGWHYHGTRGLAPKVIAGGLGISCGIRWDRRPNLCTLYYVRAGYGSGPTGEQYCVGLAFNPCSYRVSWIERLDRPRHGDQGRHSSGTLRGRPMPWEPVFRHHAAKSVPANRSLASSRYWHWEYGVLSKKSWPEASCTRGGRGICVYSHEHL